MATNQEVIDRAGMELGIIEDSDSMSATDSADALTVLNEMMAEWRYSGKDFNWFSQDTLGDTIPIPDWAKSGVISNLAVKCGPVFRAPVTSELSVQANKGNHIITRTIMNLNLKRADMTHLPQGRYYNNNILTDA